jgi:hypothetical protein
VARWLIRITGKQRREVDIDLIVQAVIALGHQLAEEEQGGDDSVEARITKASAGLLAANHLEDAS